MYKQSKLIKFNHILKIEICHLLGREFISSLKRKGKNRSKKIFVLTVDDKVPHNFDDLSCPSAYCLSCAGLKLSLRGELSHFKGLQSRAEKIEYESLTYVCSLIHLFMMNLLCAWYCGGGINTITELLIFMASHSPSVFKNGVPPHVYSSSVDNRGLTRDSL